MRQRYTARVDYEVLIATGERGSGKTTALIAALGALDATLRERTAGVYTTTTRDAAGAPRALALVRVDTGATHPLAAVDPEGYARFRRLGLSPDWDASAARFGPFHFDREAFAWATSVVAAPLSTPSAIILDEVGPLEMRYDDGLSAALDRALEEAACLVVTVRPRLASALIARVGAAGRTAHAIEAAELAAALSPLLERWVA